MAASCFLGTGVRVDAILPSAIIPRAPWCALQKVLQPGRRFTKQRGILWRWRSAQEILNLCARALRARLPDANLIVCADDDAATDGNPGMSKAKAAALAVGGKLAIPTFGADRPAGASDFNDLAAHCGSEAVTKAIQQRAQATTDPSKRNSLPLLL